MSSPSVESAWRALRRGSAGGVVMVAVAALLLGLMAVRALPSAGGATATAGGLSVFVGYAEDKETINPDPATFPVPWAGSPGVTFLGGTVPGQSACGTLATCYDAGAIRLDNPSAAPITVGRVTVDDHSSLVGGKVFDNLWGSFTVPAGRSVILTENPPASNPGYDNFDTSGFPATCTPITVPPTVTITVGGVATTLADSTHVIDSGGIDAGSCSPKQDESIQWRPIGSAGTSRATLTLGPTATTAPAGTSVTETATLLDGSGQGLPDAVVAFSVTNGPDTGTTGTAVTDAGGNVSFALTGAPGEDTVVAQVTTIGSFSSTPTHVLWTDGSSAGWTGSDVGSPSPPGGQSFDAGTGTWTVSGGGSGPGGTADQLHLVNKPLATTGGAEARVTSLTGGSAATAGVMLRSGTDAGVAVLHRAGDPRRVGRGAGPGGGGRTELGPGDRPGGPPGLPLGGAHRDHTHHLHLTGRDHLVPAARLDGHHRSRRGRGRRAGGELGPAGCPGLGHLRFGRGQHQSSGAGPPGSLPVAVQLCGHRQPHPGR